MAESLEDRLKRHEGKKTVNDLHVVYKDSRGFNTIAYGSLVDPPGGLTEDEAEYLLLNRIRKAQVQASTSLPWFSGIGFERQNVIVELIFWLGLGGFLEFKKMISALEQGLFATAASELLNSELAIEAPSRTMELADILSTG